MQTTTDQSAAPRVIAIENSPVIVRLLQSHLAGERIELHVASTGEEGLALVRSLKPELVLLDIDLPDLSGFDVVHELKSDPETHDVAVIFVSGGVTTEDKVRGLDMGAVDFISKPFDVAELRARVRSALRVKALIAMLAQRAQLDGLTGLWNRTYFDQQLERAMASAQRTSKPLSLIICDIDHFKRINDEYGHPFGDRVLQHIASTLDCGRSSDIVCRYGGEEFAMILNHTDAEQAANLAERIRSGVQEHDWPDYPNLTITISFGIADTDSLDSLDADALVAAADAALYRAKHAGRNRVCIAEPMSNAPRARLSA